MTDAGAHAPRMAATGTHSVDYASATPRTTTWVGWVFFAGIMMMLLGSFQAIEGLVALFNNTYYVVGPSGLLVSVDYTTWGWVHLILGIVLVATGVGVMAGNTAARIGGIVLAAISAIVNLAFIAAYPLWSVIIITIDVIVIYALAVHGREIRSA
jgi:hypothetical protein